MIALRQSFGIFVLPLSLAICSGCGGGGSTGVGSTPATAQTYTIGGVVSGLVDGASLQLSNSGIDAITISTNGAFAFDRAVGSAGTYDVWISKEPLDPVQFCVVSNGTGTASSNVVNIQVVCNTPTEKTLYDFGQQPDGANPNGTPVFDSSGNLYGVTTYGGTSGHGTVFMLTPSNGQWRKTVLYTFCLVSGCADGSEPGAGLVWDSAGNLYGTANDGGAFGGGVAFKLSPNASGTWTETVLHSFGDGTDGSGASGMGISELVFDTSGNLYGTTTYGGAPTCDGGICCSDCGTAFELSPKPDGTWIESVIHNFCIAPSANCPDGDYPMGGLAIDASGNLYGTTSSGGGYPFQAGTVFQLSPQGGGKWAQKVLYAFQPVNDAANPQAGVILDAAGNLYGTTYGGGGVGGGTVFKVARGTGGQWQERVLYSFNMFDGFLPSAPLVFDKAGNLYGTTSGGGPVDAGVVFALTPGLPNSPWAEAPLYSFGYVKNGIGNISGLAMDAQGNLYDAGAVLGTDGNGIVFSVTP